MSERCITVAAVQMASGAWDFERNIQYAVNWLWGYTTVGINLDKVKAALGSLPMPENAWDLIFKPEYASKLKSCGVSFLDSASEVVPAALLKSVRPYVTLFSSPGYVDDMVTGSLCVAMGWSGNLASAQSRAVLAGTGQRIQVLMPKSGGILFFDTMVIPADAPHAANAARADYYGGEFMGWGMAGVFGRAPNFVNPTANTNVGLVEIDAYYIRGNWTLQGQLSYGMQKEAAITADPVTGAYRTASWYGLSALAAYKITPTLEGIARFDCIANARNGGGLLGYGADYRNGIGPDGNLGCAAAYTSGCDQGANRYALWLGLNYAFNDNVSFKAEYRYDWSNLAVFDVVSDDSDRRSNNVLGAAVVVGF